MKEFLSGLASEVGEEEELFERLKVESASSMDGSPSSDPDGASYVFDHVPKKNWGRLEGEAPGHRGRGAGPHRRGTKARPRHSTGEEGLLGGGDRVGPA